jgi:hypothetical protein
VEGRQGLLPVALDVHWRFTAARAGAIINGTGFDAANLTATPAAAGASGGTRQFNGTDGGPSTAAALGAFGSALATNPDGTFNATAGQLVGRPRGASRV